MGDTPLPAAPWYESRGIWGGILSIASLLLGAFGISALDAETQAKILDNLMVVIPGFVALVTSVLGLIGRAKATTQVTLTASKAAAINSTLPKSS